MSMKSASAAIAICIWSVSAAVAPVASADPSAVIQYSAAVPSADGGDPNGGANSRPPTPSREVFERVPPLDVYALSQIALSPELGGYGGIAGITGPAYAGAGQTYPDEDSNVAEALFDSLGSAGALALIALAAAILAVALAARRTATPGA